VALVRRVSAVTAVQAILGLHVFTLVAHPPQVDVNSPFMAELKTKPTGKRVADFLKGVDEARRKDCNKIVAMMKRATKSQPRMWGPSIVGFGDYHYKYASGREADWFLTGFSPRKQDLTLYISSGFDRHAELTQRLGKFKTGKSCLYIKRLADVDLDVLEQLIQRSVARTEGRQS
jgi:hypothetical protein